MTCDRCGRKFYSKTDLTSCVDCRAVTASAGRYKPGQDSDDVLTDGYWYNDNGIMRWRNR